MDIMRTQVDEREQKKSWHEEEAEDEEKQEWEQEPEDEQGEEQEQEQEQEQGLPWLNTYATQVSAPMLSLSLA